MQRCHRRARKGHQTTETKLRGNTRGELNCSIARVCMAVTHQARRSAYVTGLTDQEEAKRCRDERPVVSESYADSKPQSQLPVMYEPLAKSPIRSLKSQLPCVIMKWVELPFQTSNTTPISLETTCCRNGEERIVREATYSSVPCNKLQAAKKVRSRRSLQNPLLF